MPQYEQIPLGAVKYGLFPESILCSPDNRHFAYAIQSRADSYAVAPMGSPGMKYIVVQDGEPGSQEFDAIRFESMKYSHDGNRLGYMGVRDGKQHAIVDGTVSAGYAAIGKDSPLFSPDSRRVAYAAAPKRGESFYIVDGKQTDTFISVTGLRFSPDSKRFSYIGTRNSNETCAVVDDEYCEPFESIGEPGIVFSPNSKRFAFVAFRGAKHVIVVDGHVGPSFEDIGTPIFSDDSEHVAYEAKVGGTWRIVFDHEVADERFASIGSAGVGFRPNSSDVVCAVMKKSFFKGTKWYPKIGDQLVGKGYDGIGIGSPVFSPDGKRMACAVQIGTKSNWSVLSENTLGPFGEGVFEPVFSPDSAHMAYHYHRGGQYFVVHDGHKSNAFGGVGGTGFRFTLDSSELVFDATVKGKEYLYVGADRYGPFDGFLKSSGLAMDSNGVLIALVNKGYSIERIEIDISK